MPTISSNLESVRARIAAACKAVGREPHAVTLLAVSKTRPPEDVALAFAAGQQAFGENYVQEGVAKREALKAEFPGLEWHFIGPLQSNKTRAVAECFDWVHTVDRLKIAERLSQQRPETLPPLNVCIQVNVSGEASKSGVSPAEACDFAEAVSRLPRIVLRGLMTIPEPTEDHARLREQFALLRRLKEALLMRGLETDTLSMGMSDDLELAIAEGATLVRVGTAIFGARSKISP